jgi:hypothetical protein
MKPSGVKVAASGHNPPISANDEWQEIFSKLSQLSGGKKLELGVLPEKGFGKTVPAKVRAVVALINGVAQGVDAQQLRDVPVEVADAAQLFVSSERLPEQMSRLIERLGKQWMDLCPVDPRVASKLHVLNLCQCGMMAQALAFSETLIQNGQAWGAEIRDIVQLRQGIALLAAEKLEEASRAFEGILKSPGGSGPATK